ncbi:hypothetical protein FHU41_002799 [Psychromicrobium silvestre]|uniref:Secreted protein n=1 Tax=Psychromicrobium silvestre TaxID=1645614 RepID=A0A7Y9LVU5_9MICC|nr:DUF5719 family protein [Psychromicrobium silvestre]NYE96549.1 hypothetical protein [Psychromicrobium silvestre]
MAESKTRAAAKSRTVFGVLSGTGIAVLAGAVVAAGSLFPGAAAGKSLEAQAAQLPAGQTIANCVGPAQLLQASADGTDPQFSAASTSAKNEISALVLSNDKSVLPNSVLSSLKADSTTAPLAKISSQPSSVPSATPGAAPSLGKAAALQAKSTNSPSVLRVDPVNDQRTPASAVQLFSASDGDLRGLAGSSCQSPSNDAWLLGASTEVGRTAVLNLSNSSSTPATVNLDLYGSAGQIQNPGAKGLLVAPGTNRAIVLAGLAPGQKELAVHLRSTGGAVSAVIQQSVLRGLTPGGVENLGTVAAPNQHQVIPGVLTMAPSLASQISSQSDYADAQTTLQVAVPGAADTVVQVKVYGQSGPAALPNGGVFTAKAGAVSELALSGLPAGAYTVELSADAQITASVRSVRGSKTGEPVDLASSAAATKLADNQLITLPAGVASRLVFTAPSGKAKLSLTPVQQDGTLQAAKSLDLNGGTTVLLDPTQLAGAGVVGFLVSASGDAAYGSQLINQKGGNGLTMLAIPRSVVNQSSVPISLGY